MYFVFYRRKSVIQVWNEQINDDRTLIFVYYPFKVSPITCHIKCVQTRMSMCAWS